jgi:CRP/FNR family transcriptional regulator, cyclic AMP receptor protein
MRTMRDIVAATPMFADLEPAHLDLVAGCARNARYASGEIIFKEGARADSFVLVTHGRAAVEVFVPTAGPRIVHTAGPGDALGFSWLFPPHRYRSDVRALELIRALEFDARCLRDKAAEDHALCCELLRRFAALAIAELESARAQLVDMYANAGVG